VQSNTILARTSLHYGSAAYSASPLDWRRRGVRKALTLLWHRFRPAPGAVVVELFWHISAIPEGAWVFLHFVDDRGEICFQGDYPIGRAAPSPFGFLLSQRRIEIPAGTLPGCYNLRVGVWLPVDGRHLPLTRVRGYDRGRHGWVNTAQLGSVQI